MTAMHQQRASVKANLQRQCITIDLREVLYEKLHQSALTKCIGLKSSGIRLISLLATGWLTHMFEKLDVVDEIVQERWITCVADALLRTLLLDDDLHVCI